MKKSLIFATALAVVSFGALGACQQDNKAILDRLAVMDKKIDEIKAQRVGGTAPQQRPQRPAPDPSKTYAVPVEDSPAIGNPNALVTIVKAYEYACPFCQKARPTLDQVHETYGDKVRVVYQPFVVHPQTATLPAQATCAGHRQGKFKEIDQLLWDKVFAARKFEESVIAGLGKDGGLDAAKYQADLKSPECQAWVRKHMNNLSQFGVGATPGFFINGRFLSGAQPFPAFKAIIDEELKKAEERVAQGTPAANYYKTWVLEKGLKKLEPPK